MQKNCWHEESDVSLTNNKYLLRESRSIRDKTIAYSIRFSRFICKRHGYVTQYFIFKIKAKNTIRFFKILSKHTD